MRVLLDTNVFVSAAFNRKSHSARIIDRIRRGELAFVWNDATRFETRHVLEKIPPISWGDFVDVFQPQHHDGTPTHPERFTAIPDPTDRKFAALAHVTDATLISSDHHLVGVRDVLPVTVLTPGEFVRGGQPAAQ